MKRRPALNGGQTHLGGFRVARAGEGLNDFFQVERGLLRLEDAVRKMTSLSASKLGFRDRGLLREGMFADITLFDADKVIDRATYTDPFQYSEGIAYVVVNGQIVLDQGKHTGARPGKALRRVKSEG